MNEQNQATGQLAGETENKMHEIHPVNMTEKAVLHTGCGDTQNSCKLSQAAWTRPPRPPLQKAKVPSSRASEAWGPDSRALMSLCKGLEATGEAQPRTSKRQPPATRTTSKHQPPATRTTWALRENMAFPGRNKLGQGGRQQAVGRLGNADGKRPVQPSDRQERL